MQSLPLLERTSTGCEQSAGELLYHPSSITYSGCIRDVGYWNLRLVAVSKADVSISMMFRCGDIAEEWYLGCCTVWLL
jgi:hypothetical protein